MLKSNLQKLRFLAVLEGISWLLLLGSMFLKYKMDMPEPNKVIGMVHGLLFILYCLYVYIVSQELNWKFKTTALAFLASLPPFGTFIADAKLFKPLIVKAH